MNNPMSRRGFFTSACKFVAAISVAPMVMRSLSVAQERRGGGVAPAGGSKEIDWPVADPGKDVALAMRYHHSHEEAKADSNVNKVEKAGVTWENQTCSNCNFYKKVGMKKVKVGGKDQEVEVGTCTIFPQKLVAGAGICNSWAKKV